MLRHRVQVEAREPSLQALSWPIHKPAGPFREKWPSVTEDGKGEPERREARTFHRLFWNSGTAQMEEGPYGTLSGD